jgi:hypothetical protein
VSDHGIGTVCVQPKTDVRGGNLERRRGEVSERPKERDWKSRTRRKAGRGFKSRPLRLEGPNPAGGRDSALPFAVDQHYARKTMPTIAFAIGSKPEVSSDEAENLAALLVLRRRYSAFRLASRIRLHSAVAALDPKGGPGKGIELSSDELKQLAIILDQMPGLEAAPGLANLRREIVAARAR